MGRRIEGLVLLAVLAALAATALFASAADVDVKTTFLTALDNGGGYIEYNIHGAAAAELRSRIDNASHMFPFETIPADGDGTIDMAEGERYMLNLDDILTRRTIVLRGIKLDNVDVDDHTGLVGSDVNDTGGIYFHITFRGHIQYDSKEFNVSGLEPLEVLWGSYEDIPPTLTVDESTLIVAAGLTSYQKITKSHGTLFNLRVPMAAVVSWSGTYAVSNPPSARMEYTHSGFLGNPIVLAVLILLFTFLALRLPKAAAADNGKERVRWLHWGFLAFIIVVWLFYFLGGAAVLVWFLTIGGVLGVYYVSHMVYAKGWRGLAEDKEGIDLGKGLEAVEADEEQTVRGYMESLRPAPVPDEGTARDEGPVVVDAGGPRFAPPPPPGPVARVAVRVAAPPVAAGPGPNGANGRPLPPPPPSVKMRCPQCGAVFKVPGTPRPLSVKCPSCGKTGMIR